MDAVWWVLSASAPERLGAAAAAMAVVHLLLAHRRDLGPPVLTLGAMALLLSTGSEGLAVRPTTTLALWAAAALLVAGWVRGGLQGVGHWRLDGALGVLAVAAGTLDLWWTVAAPGLPLERAAGAGVGGVAVVGLLGTALALERPAPRARKVPVRRRVPVEPEVGERVA